jgi:hypothetical protein
MFIPASYARFVVAERHTKAKHQQLVSGLSLFRCFISLHFGFTALLFCSVLFAWLCPGIEGPAYWISTYLWDIINYMVPCLLSAIIILAFQNPSFTGINFWPTILSFLFYGLSVVSFSYFTSFFFSDPGNNLSFSAAFPLVPSLLSHHFSSSLLLLCSPLFPLSFAGNAQNILLMIYFATGLVLLILSVILSSFDSTKAINAKLLYVVLCFYRRCSLSIPSSSPFLSFCYDG